MIRKCRATEFDTICDLINDAAQAYRGVIPPDCWHEPYMSSAEFQREIEDGVIFWCLERQGELLGVMGFQDKGEVTLIRHAYVRPQAQQSGVGTRLLGHLEGLTTKPILIGTWADASWAIAFYGQNGYALLPTKEKNRLLKTYWTISERQIETSVVLAKADVFDGALPWASV